MDMSKISIDQIGWNESDTALKSSVPFEKDGYFFLHDILNCEPDTEEYIEAMGAACDELEGQLRDKGILSIVQPNGDPFVLYVRTGPEFDVPGKALTLWIEMMEEIIHKVRCVDRSNLSDETFLKFMSDLSLMSDQAHTLGAQARALLIASRHNAGTSFH